MRGRTLLTSFLGFSIKFVGKEKPDIHYPIFIQSGENKKRHISLYKQQLPLTHIARFMCLVKSLHLVPSRQRHQKCLLAFLSAITRNGVVKLVPSNSVRNAGLVCLNIYRKIHKRTNIPLQHFTRKNSGYLYLYFLKGWRGCVKMFTSYITMTL